MKFDRKLFGERLKAAIQARHGEHGLSAAVRILNQAGLDKLTQVRLSEYVSGVKVPTLERFTLMVMLLELDVSIIFPGWGQKMSREPRVKAIRHPLERQTI